MPPVTDAVTAVLNACGVSPYSGTAALSQSFASAAAALVPLIVSYKGPQTEQVPQQRALNDMIVTGSEYAAYEDLDSFKNVIADENTKRKGRPVPPRRQRCADAFLAQFKAGTFSGYAPACAYVAKEAPE